MGQLLSERPEGREASIQYGVDVTRTISSPDHFDEDRAREMAVRQFDHGINPLGTGRQLLAILSSGSRAEGLATLDIPALVVHGRQDKLVDFSGGQRTAELIAGAQFCAIDDMGHDLPMAHWKSVVDEVAGLIDRAGDS